MLDLKLLYKYLCPECRYNWVYDESPIAIINTCPICLNGRFNNQGYWDAVDVQYINHSTTSIFSLDSILRIEQGPALMCITEKYLNPYRQELFTAYINRNYLIPGRIIKNRFMGFNKFNQEINKQYLYYVFTNVPPF